jgi:hypothetical protein
MMRADIETVQKGTLLPQQRLKLVVQLPQLVLTYLAAGDDGLVGDKNGQILRRIKTGNGTTTEGKELERFTCTHIIGGPGKRAITIHKDSRFRV